MSFPFLAEQTTDPNRVIRMERNEEYPKYSWYVIGSFLGVVAICHTINLVILWRRCSYQPKTILETVEGEKDVASESGASVVPKAISIRRLPLAILNSYRSIAFRMTVPVGRNHVINFAEVLLMSAYIILLFSLTFLGCKTILFHWNDDTDACIHTSGKNVTTGVVLDYNYWSNRAASIAVSQFTLIVALAMKNNVISCVYICLYHVGIFIYTHSSPHWCRL